MSGKKEQKPEISKKADKMIDNHREFLDMDTDEEDFGPQESPEVEEELPPEPEKPVFTERDLITLEVYKPMGLTTLYVPKENISKTFLEPSEKIDCFLLGEDIKTILLEEDERKRKIVDRLEKIVWAWIKQIHRETRVVPSRRKIEGIQEEVNYWNAKHLNLNYLKTQLLNPEVRSIIDILRNLRSVSVNKFDELARHIKERLKETLSNLTYLNILLDFCKNLTVPENSENSITEVLLLILFIWTESPFYRDTNNIETLCQAFSSQIVHQCKNYIKLDVALESNPEEGMKVLKKCIFCCDIYKVIYDNLMTNVVSYINSDKKWDVNKTEVFNKIDTFKQRCYDVYEICEALVLFGRYNKIGLFGGTRGIEYDAYWREIENIFYEILNEIIAVRDIIFDITNSNWLKKFKRFKYTILQLENMIVNLINDIFKSVKNIEEGIEAIYTLQKFKKRDSLREILQNKWMQVWTIFNNEIEYCYTNAINASKIYELSEQKTDINVNMLCISQYLKAQYNIMINAMDWIGDCVIEQCTLQQYRHVLDVIDKRRKMFNTYNTYGTQ
ncbi:uncharacterized protein LOC143151119 isoform X3 [Ptiloglossa arizonensis]|uniref:uncharacterized protein LOC143151119 isoform X3 n=1 Tax=Ptiloglossa arizonensis TaxID=3350558 RepID=UPI003FA0326B